MELFKVAFGDSMAGISCKIAEGDKGGAPGQETTTTTLTLTPLTSFGWDNVEAKTCLWPVATAQVGAFSSPACTRARSSVLRAGKCWLCGQGAKIPQILLRPSR